MTLFSVAASEKVTYNWPTPREQRGWGSGTLTPPLFYLHLWSSFYFLLFFFSLKFWRVSQSGYMCATGSWSGQNAIRTVVTLLLCRNRNCFPGAAADEEGGQWLLSQLKATAGGWGRGEGWQTRAGRQPPKKKKTSASGRHPGEPTGHPATSLHCTHTYSEGRQTEQDALNA